MYTVFDVFFFLNFIYFFLAVFLAFFIPGNILLRPLKLPKFQEIIVSTILGIGLWGVQGFIFGYLNLRMLSYLYLFAALVYWMYVFFNTRSYKKFRFKKIKIDPIVLVIIFFGSLMQLSAIYLVGVRFPDGIHYCCTHRADNILELGIINEVVKNFPPYEPGMYPVQIQNYHYWGHLVAGELIRVFKLPLVATSFQYMTVLLSLSLGLLAIAVSDIMKLGNVFKRWVLLFLYFGGDLAFLLFAFLGKGFIFPINAMESGQAFLANYPRAFAVVIFLAGFYLLIHFAKKKELYVGFLAAILLGITIGFKVYVGLFALSGLGFLIIYYLVKKKFRMVLPLTVAFLISFVIYYPVNKAAGGLTYTGFWRVENFISLPSLGLIRLWMAKDIYAQHNNYPKLAIYELLFSTVYLVNTFGTKLIGIVQTKKSLKKFPIEVNVFMIPAMLVSMIIGLFFWQNVGGANTFNFLINVFILSSFYAALSCFYFLSKLNRYIKTVLIVLIILLTVPRSIYNATVDNYNAFINEFAYVSDEEIDALKYLRNNTNRDSVVLVDPNFALDVDSPYVSYMADRHMFLSGRKDELEAHGINFDDRKGVVDSILGFPPKEVLSNRLIKNDIDYLYLSPSRDVGKAYKSVLKRVFTNNVVSVYEVLKQ